MSPPFGYHHVETDGGHIEIPKRALIMKVSTGPLAYEPDDVSSNLVTG
jgi:hypothetical protein